MSDAKPGEEAASEKEAEATPNDASEGARRDLPSWNRGRTKKRKQKADADDAFQKGMKDASRGAANRWPLLLGGLAVVALGIAGGVWWRQHREAQSAETTRILAEAVAYEARAQIGDPNSPLAPRNAPIVESEEARDAVIEAKLEALASEGGPVNVDAELLRARRALAKGDAAGALEIYERFLSASSKSHPLYFLGQEGKAIALEDQGQLDEALSAYEALAGKKNSFYRDMALWHQGRLLEEMDRNDDALAIYRQYLEEFPLTEHSLARTEVRGRLEELDPGALEAATTTDAAAVPAGAPAAAPTPGAG